MGIPGVEELDDLPRALAAAGYADTGELDGPGGLGPVGEAGRHEEGAGRSGHAQRGIGAVVQLSPECLQAPLTLARQRFPCHDRSLSPLTASLPLGIPRGFPFPMRP